jgi:chromate reductase, NAD(P)H dehydrogenase (quinone)
VRILGVSGSLRRDSHNSRLLLAAAALLPPGVELVTFDRLKEIPPYDADDDAGDQPAVVAFREAVAEADAVLIATPEYNHSLPGQLKNALDWLSRPLATSPFRGKPAAVIGASTGSFGAVWAQAEARKVLAALGARVVDRELPVPTAEETVHPEGRLNEVELETALRELLAELHASAQERALAA